MTQWIDPQDQEILSSQRDEIGGLWSRANFKTPLYDPTNASLFLHVTVGRGHLFLNGHDLGRFWNISSSKSLKYTQQFYFIPVDFLHVDGNLNEIIFFDAFGNDQQNTSLILSWTEASNDSTFMDEINFPMACLLWSKSRFQPILKLRVSKAYTFSGFLHFAGFTHLYNQVLCLK